MNQIQISYSVRFRAFLITFADAKGAVVGSRDESRITGIHAAQYREGGNVILNRFGVKIAAQIP